MAQRFNVIAMNGVYRKGFENLCCQFCKTDRGVLVARLNPDGEVIEGDIICNDGCPFENIYAYENGKYVIAMCEECNLPKKECSCILCDDCGELMCECTTCPKCAYRGSPYDFCEGGCGCGLCCCDETCIYKKEDK